MRRRLTLLKRLRFYLALLIVPLILVGVIQYMVTLRSAEKSAIKFSNQIIDRISSEIEEILIDYNNISLMISEDPEILEVLNSPLSENMTEKLATDYDIDSRLYYMTTYNKQLNGIYLIAENGGKFKSNYTTLKSDDLRESDWYKLIIEKNQTIWFGNHNESFAANSSGKSMISMGAPVKDANTGTVLGVVVVDIEESILTELINSEIGSDGIIFVIDENNTVVSHPDRTQISSTFVIDHSELTYEEYGASSYYLIEDNKSVIVYKQLNINSWKVVASLPKGKMTEDINSIQILMIVSWILVMGLALFATRNITYYLVQPVREMMLKMKEVEGGNMSVQMPIHQDDELGDLSRSFNRMIVKVDELMTTIYDEQKKMRKAELSALQSQINPHFLYNTLSTIIWMARANENDKIIKIVTAITKYYRIGISRGRDIISLEDEIEHMRNYLVIMSHQYGDQFDYDIEAPKELYRFKSMKLVLQPIVENAIQHGIKGIREKGYIGIRIADHGDHLIFSVKDTGIGIEEKQLAKLNRIINDFSGAHPESYGLRNVNERIKIFFGGQYGIEIKSIQGEGTEVEVKIPKIAEA